MIKFSLWMICVAQFPALACAMDQKRGVVESEHIRKELSPRKIPAAYSQTDLFQEVILPLAKSYPEILWFADQQVAVTHEGKVSGLSDESWTAQFVQQGLLPKANRGVHQKYIELERMLHSLLCFHLLLDGSESAYQYWVQKQSQHPLERESFQKLHELMRNAVPTVESKIAMEASLVYSDLGKTPEAKKRAKQLGLAVEDHDDFMEKVYLLSPDMRKQILPSFNQLAFGIQNHVLKLHLTLPLHWGHVFHLEGGREMFSKVMQSQEKVTPLLIQQAYLIQVCDVAAAQAHVESRGFTAFNESKYLGYQMVFETVQKFLGGQSTTGDLAALALRTLTLKKANQLGYETQDLSEFSLVLVRIGAFLRLYTPEQGILLKQSADAVWTDRDRLLVQEMFGLESGINTWKRNPTYMPAVIVNLFHSTSDPSLQYKKALKGVLVIAKILKAYEERHLQSSEIPLCFNALAAQAKVHPEWFDESLKISQLNWNDPRNITILSKE